MRRTLVSLFVIALSIRAIIAVLQMMYGINSSLNLDSYLYGYFNPGLEIYHDFYSYYIVQLADLSRGLTPYKDFAYSYPPLFLYSLYPLYSAGGSIAASVPIWLSDAATAPLVYLVAQRFTIPRIALFAGISYAISPFFLFYEGYLWFSSQPMTFFMVLSLYLLLTNRPLWASLAFAVSALFKQELILLLPLYIVWYLKNTSRPIMWKALLAITTIVFAVSLPFLLMSPAQYITSMSYGFIGHSFSPSLSAVSSGSLSQATDPPKLATTSAISLSCNTISNTWRSLICNYGSFTYTDAKLIAPWTTIFTAAFIDQIGIWIFFPLIAVVLYNIVRLRRDETVLFLLGSVILTAFLAVFAFQVHSIYRYYLIPCYIFPLICCKTRRSLCFAVGLPLASLLLPSGNVQLLFPLLAVLTVLLLNQRSSEHQEEILAPNYAPLKL